MLDMRLFNKMKPYFSEMYIVCMCMLFPKYKNILYNM